LPDQPHGAPCPAGIWRGARTQCISLRPGRFLRSCGQHHADPYRPCPPVGAQPPGTCRSVGASRAGQQGDPLMEVVIAIAIGVLFGSGVWLILRPRTFQVITGLLLLSYAVNLFIFIMGRLSINLPPLTLEE